MFGITPFERRDIWDPVRAFERDFFRGFEPSSGLRTDIKDQGDKYLLECEMPGFDKKDITIDLDGNALTLCAKRSEERESKEDGQYIRRERSYGSYCRSFDISDIDEKSIEASYDNGILKLVLPKKVKGSSEVKRIELH